MAEAIDDVAGTPQRQFDLAVVASVQAANVSAANVVGNGFLHYHVPNQETIEASP